MTVWKLGPNVASWLNERALLPVDGVERVDVVALHAVAGPPDAHQALGLAEGQRPPEHGVGGAPQGDETAEADGEDGHDERRYAGVAAEGAQGKTEIAGEGHGVVSCE